MKDAGSATLLVSKKEKPAHLGLDCKYLSVLKGSSDTVSTALTFIHSVLYILEATMLNAFFLPQFPPFTFVEPIFGWIWDLHCSHTVHVFFLASSSVPLLVNCYISTVLHNASFSPTGLLPNGNISPRDYFKGFLACFLHQLLINRVEYLSGYTNMCVAGPRVYEIQTKWGLALKNLTL